VLVPNLAHGTINTSVKLAPLVPDFCFMALLLGGLKLKHFLRGKQPAPPTDNKAFYTNW
jgi:hypothetical protein